MKSSHGPLRPGFYSRRQFMAMALPFALALPGYRFEFPLDHFAHPEFQTEWWYYTGNLRAGTRRFGFQLTFFRRAASRDAAAEVWSADPVWFAHSALSDIDGGRFHHAQRLNRSGPGLAGADLERGIVWNGNWQASHSQLRSIDTAYSLNLRLDPRKPPVIHGVNGVSQKAAGEGRGSHYISLTRIAAEGTLLLDGNPIPVRGLAWMDHEFFTHQLEAEQVGWDWFSIQLDEGSELMLFRLRRRDGSADPFSAGTYVDATGSSRHLPAREFQLSPLEYWTSPQTQARYPLRWRIEVPGIGVSLTASTRLKSQELVSQSKLSPTYWEGAVEYSGMRSGRAVAGVGYLEMTGYDKPIGPI